MKTPDFKKIPSKEILLESDTCRRWSALLGRLHVSRIIDNVLSRLKSEASKEGIPEEKDLLQGIDDECREIYRIRVIRVINATGIVLHTNMGRSPISPEVWDACKGVNTGYSNLEFNLKTGKRGKRNGILPILVSLLTGSEASMVVNNNAAAVFLVLQALAKGKEVVVSRGEQVQIGGGFRIPEILSLSGARLVEVGTTNITTLEDYKKAFSESTACVLSVHRSNFALRGFTSQPTLSELKSILPPGVFLYMDQGSGVLRGSMKGEIPVESILKQGADLVSFSCDKVLGGPQGGIIAGKANLIRKLETHQLYRVFRPGKTIYSLLEEMLLWRVNGTFSPAEGMPADVPTLMDRAHAVAAAVNSPLLEVVSTECSTGGGSGPDETYPSAGLRIAVKNADSFLTNLRNEPVPVVGYIINGSVYLDLVAVDPHDDALLAETVKRCLGAFS
ncbi:MAG: L-seryl-tRNA(Sec) selenium transferase [Spirochaetales bacterium]|nr:L-seryl-tRNA(Sec) selenium transferase [Spirochaetales bacterium]